MNILVINGSPQGNNSITLQTVLFIQKKFPREKWNYLNIGGSIKALVKNSDQWTEKIRKADLILFSYPVYTFLVPSQLYQFIEILSASEIDLKGKYAAQILTSKHFYDVTAENFMRLNLLDLGFRYLGALSADMEDLLHEEGQKEAAFFWKHLVWRMEEGLYESLPEGNKCREKAAASSFSESDAAHEVYRRCTKASICTPEEKKEHARIAIVTDLSENDHYLKAMIDRLDARLPYRVDIVNLREFSFAGGCLGCLHCVIAGHCVYRDGFEDFLRNRIQTADGIVYAFSIHNHAMGSLFKIYDDRQFVNGHRTVTMGKPIGYLVHGELSREKNLRLMLEARAETGGNYLSGIASDETDPDAEIDRMAAELSYAIENHYQEPKNFFGVGGGKIFRDLVYEMRGFMREDHRFYKENHLYDDLPNRQKGMTIAMYAAGAAMKNDRIRKAVESRMAEGMLGPYKKVIEKADEVNQTVPHQTH